MWNKRWRNESEEDYVVRRAGHRCVGVRFDLLRWHFYSLVYGNDILVYYPIAKTWDIDTQAPYRDAVPPSGRGTWEDAVEAAWKIIAARALAEPLPPLKQLPAREVPDWLPAYIERKRQERAAKRKGKQRGKRK